MKFIINAIEEKGKNVTYYADDVDMFEKHANVALERGKITSIEAEYIREVPSEVVCVAKDCGVPIAGLCSAFFCVQTSSCFLSAEKGKKDM